MIFHVKWRWKVNKNAGSWKLEASVEHLGIISTFYLWDWWHFLKNAENTTLKREINASIMCWTYFLLTRNSGAFYFHHAGNIWPIVLKITVLFHCRKMHASCLISYMISWWKCANHQWSQTFIWALKTAMAWPCNWHWS